MMDVVTATTGTHERELTAPVDLSTPDGRRLNPQAVGWSRRPLHRANLRGGWGRNKRWDYWAILAGDLVVSSVYADVDYLGLADVWWADLASGRTGGRAIVVPAGTGIRPARRAGDAHRCTSTDDGLDLAHHRRRRRARTRITRRGREDDGARGTPRRHGRAARRATSR